MKQQKEEKNNNTKRNTIVNELFNSIKEENIVSNASNLIKSAVNILEEEIAAGIMAAKKIEKKTIHFEETNNSPDDLMDRIRRDTHEAVDLILDSLTAITQQINSLSNSLKKEDNTKKETESSFSKKENSNSVLRLISEKPVRPGELVQFQFTISEDSLKDKKIRFQKNDFIGPNQQIISSKVIKLAPSIVNLQNLKEVDVTISVKIPLKTTSGKYNSLITDFDNESLLIILSIEVI